MLENWHVETSNIENIEERKFDGRFLSGKLVLCDHELHLIVIVFIVGGSISSISLLTH